MEGAVAAAGVLYIIVASGFRKHRNNWLCSINRIYNILFRCFSNEHLYTGRKFDFFVVYGDFEIHHNFQTSVGPMLCALLIFAASRPRSDLLSIETAGPFETTFSRMTSSYNLKKTMLLETSLNNRAYCHNCLTWRQPAENPKVRIFRRWPAPHPPVRWGLDHTLWLILPGMRSIVRSTLNNINEHYNSMCVKYGHSPH